MKKSYYNNDIYKVVKKCTEEINNVEMIKIIKCIYFYIVVLGLLLVVSVIQRISMPYLGKSISVLYKVDLFNTVDILSSFLIKILLSLVFFLVVLILCQLFQQQKRGSDSKDKIPFFIAYNVVSKERMLKSNLQDYLESIYKKYLKNSLYFAGYHNNIFIMIGSALQAEVSTKGKREDISINQFVEIKLRNTGGLCVKIGLSGVVINNIEYMKNKKLDDIDFLLDLSKDKQDIIIGISEIFVLDSVLKELLLKEENECNIQFDLTLTNIYSERYQQKVALKRFNGKWEYKTEEIKFLNNMQKNEGDENEASIR